MAHKSINRRFHVVVESRPAETEGQPGLCKRRFWLLALGVVSVSILTWTFDFSLSPPSYHGLFITRPYYGLHSWASANHAWAARSHLKYGLGYTKGYHTPAVGYPPPANPQRYVSPPLETLITAFGMLLLGIQGKDCSIHLRPEESASIGVNLSGFSFNPQHDW